MTDDDERECSACGDTYTADEGCDHDGLNLCPADLYRCRECADDMHTADLEDRWRELKGEYEW